MRSELPNDEKAGDGVRGFISSTMAQQDLYFETWVFIWKQHVSNPNPH